jgi:hypothetical protein
MLTPPPSLLPKLHFSGHETFPLRQLWLHKAFDRISECDQARAKNIFAEQEAIIYFG